MVEFVIRLALTWIATALEGAGSTDKKSESSDFFFSAAASIALIWGAVLGISLLAFRHGWFHFDDTLTVAAGLGATLLLSAALVIRRASVLFQLEYALDHTAFRKWWRGFAPDSKRFKRSDSKFRFFSPEVFSEKGAVFEAWEAYCLENRNKVEAERSRDRLVRKLAERPDFLKLSLREITLRTILGLFALAIPLMVALWSLGVEIEDWYFPTVLCVLAFALLPFWISPTSAVDEHRRRIGLFRYQYSNPKFIAWCEGKGYSIRNDTGFDEFSSWYDEYARESGAEEENFGKWLKSPEGLAITGGDVASVDVEELRNAFRASKAEAVRR